MGALVPGERDAVVAEVQLFGQVCHVQRQVARANKSTSYTSFTVGTGVFYDIYLFKGFFIQPSARWWPTVASTYDKATFVSKAGGSYSHTRHDLTPFVNLNIGWTMTGI